MHTITIALISNITLEPFLLPQLQECFASSEINVTLQRIPYNEYEGSGDTLANADFVVICLNFEDLYPNAVIDTLSKRISTMELLQDVCMKCQMLQQFLSKQTKAYRLWFGFEDEGFRQAELQGSVPPLEMLIDRINLTLYEMMEECDVYLDLKHLLGRIGMKYARNNRGKYRWNAPYSKETMQAIAMEIYKQFLVHTGRTKKCLVVDCDNVLWGGVLSEDGIDNIHLAESGVGRKYADFQRFLVSLYYRGVILAVCSKNNIEDVAQVFCEHSGMILEEEQIACFQCSWKNKPEGIKAISEFLNIGLNSIVFIDDMDFEIGMVQAMLPEVVTVKFDLQYAEKLAFHFNLKNLGNIEDIQLRIKTYRTNREREKIYKKSVSHEEYLRELRTEIRFSATHSTEFARIAELTQRANQCTNGKRYTVEAIKDICSEGRYELYSVWVSDRFSSLGIVGAIGIYEGVLDLFVLSCRAMGRNVEEMMVEYACSLGAQTAYFESTGKNEKIEALLKQL